MNITNEKAYKRYGDQLFIALIDHMRHNADYCYDSVECQKHVKWFPLKLFPIFRYPVVSLFMVCLWQVIVSCRDVALLCINVVGCHNKEIKSKFASI